jgi:DNA-binding PadR family transcriptional regulator
LPRNSSLLPLRIRILLELDGRPDGLHAYRLGRTLGASNGALYPALAGLAGRGLIEVRSGTSATGDASAEERKLYVLTEGGTGQLAQIREQVASVASRPADAQPRVALA